MNRVILALLTTLAFLAPQVAPQTATQTGAGAAPQAGTGVLQGAVTRTGTSEPLSNVEVSILSAGAAITQRGMTLEQILDSAVARGGTPTAVQNAIGRAGQRAGQRGAPAAGPPVQIKTVTDTMGRYSLKGIPPGVYIVAATRDGYFGSPVGGVYPAFATASVTIPADSQAVELSMTLIPGSAASGAVRDTAGKPVAGATAVAFNVGYQNGVPVLREMASRITDDRGEFRLFKLPPGDYYIGVSPGQAGRGGRGVTAPARGGAVRTYYPSAIDPSQATPLRLKGGETITGLGIGLRTVTPVTVSGKVLNLPEGPSLPGNGRGTTTNLAAIYLVPRGRLISDNAAPATAGTTTSAGSFQIPGVTPGSYDLIAVAGDTADETANRGAGRGRGANRGAAPLPVYFVGRSTIDVGGQSLQGVTVAVSAAIEVSGRATIDGGPTAGNVTIALESEDFPVEAPGPIAQMGSAQATAAGFTVSALPNARYWPRVTLGTAARGLGGGPLSGVYVADVLLDGKSVYDTGFDVGTQPVGPLEVILKKGSGTIEGVVQGEGQKPVAGATVVLAPPMERRKNTALFDSATSDTDGKFAFRGVAPGNYTVYAWADIPVGAYRNAEFMKKYQGRGRYLTLEESGHITGQLDLIPRLDD